MRVNGGKRGKRKKRQVGGRPRPIENEKRIFRDAKFIVELRLSGGDSWNR